MTNKITQLDNSDRGILKTLDEVSKMKIDTDSSLSTLLALCSIHTLAIDLSQMRWEDEWRDIESECRERLALLSELLIRRYGETESMEEKIRILEKVEDITLKIRFTDHPFALEEAAVLEETSGLSFSRKLRLSWLPEVYFDNVSGITGKLLSGDLDLFDLETLLVLTDYCGAEERSEIFRRYFTMAEEAIEAGNLSRLSELLLMGTALNLQQDTRERMKKLMDETNSLESLPSSIKYLNLIASEINLLMEALSDKYTPNENIPA